ncbi:MAG: hypothetical protein IIU18_02520 [Oscillospiraceae bacterium]|nr:hypothetical protein [Oscillospiraceae bacterium]
MEILPHALWLPRSVAGMARLNHVFPVEAELSQEKHDNLCLLFIGCSDKPRSPVRYRGKAAAIPHPRADRRGLSSFFAPGRGQALGNFLQLVGEFSVKTHKTSGFIPVIMQQNAQKRVYILRVILYYKDRIPLRQFI